MKNKFLDTIKLALVAACVLPTVTMAQSSDKEFYLRPSHWRPYDQRGINVFETSKAPDSIPFEGPRIRFGAGFTMQFQDLKHSNTANFNTTSNRLYPLQRGFMTAQANLFTDVQLADGISMNVTTYLSSRHHSEAWVKGGYLQIDKLPFLKSKTLDKIMEIATIKVGHMEINYGDAHFRRSDAGQTLYNPFMESYILDAFATEIGGEVYLKKNGLFGMLGVTNGMIKGSVDSTYKSVVDDNIKRSPSIYLKGGIDKSIGERLRVRVSGSYYHNGSAAASGQNLYGGDRAGSNYQNVMEFAPAGAALPASTVIAFSGRVNPGYTKKVDAIMLNGFLKVQGLELFGTYETAKGRSKNEVESRKSSQIAADAIYRFGKAENFYVGGRYNSADVTLAKTAATPGNFDVKINRTALAAGWFMTKNVLMKAEIVNQKYKDFPAADFRNGGKFKGYVIEAVVGF
jgi:hypothetical protein